jgi:hypothetical protein
MPELDESLLGQPVAEGVEEPAGSTEDVEATGAVEEYEIDGKKYTADQVRESIKSGLRQDDYTRKTQEIARQRKEWDEQRNTLSQYKDAWQAVQEYPELKKALSEALSRMLAQGMNIQGADATSTASPKGKGVSPEEAAIAAVRGTEEGTVPTNPEPWKSYYRSEQERMAGQLANILAQQEQRINEMNRYAWDQWFQNRASFAQAKLPELKTKYPNLYEQEIVYAFQQNPDADLDKLAELSHKHWSKFVDERVKADIDKRKANAKIKTETPTGGQASVKGTEPAKDFDEAAARARTRLVEQLGSMFRS